MTIKEKKERLNELCNDFEDGCEGCLLNKFEYCNNKIWEEFTDNEIDECYNIVKSHNRIFGSEQREDNINHPRHYEGSTSLECIEAMQIAFGRMGVYYFCICNAFKYLWRYKNKNGSEDLDKSEWYLNKAQELTPCEDIDTQLEDLKNILNKHRGEALKVIGGEENA